MEEKEEKALETFRVLLKEKKLTALRGMAQNMNESDLAVIMEEMEDELHQSFFERAWRLACRIKKLWQNELV